MTILSLIARVRSVSITHMPNGDWVASGFSKASNTDWRGYGSTLKAALEQLVTLIENDERRHGRIR